MEQQIKGPCGIDLTNYENIVVVQSDKCDEKKKNKCKKSCCKCKVIIFELTSTAGTGGTAAGPSGNTTFVEPYDPSPIALNTLTTFSLVPNSVLQSTPNTGNVWINTLTGNIYKQFPNGYWYLQGNTNSSSNTAFSASTDTFQTVTASTPVSFPVTNIINPNLSATGFTVSETGEYYLQASLTFAQNVPGSTLVEISLVSQGIMSQIIARRPATLTFTYLDGSFFVDSTLLSGVSTLTAGSEVQVIVNVLSAPVGAIVQVSSFDSSFSGYQV